MTRGAEFEASSSQDAAKRKCPSSSDAADGTAEHWTVKDLVAHNATWKERQAIRLAAILRGEARGRAVVNPRA